MGAPLEARTGPPALATTASNPSSVRSSALSYVLIQPAVWHHDLLWPDGTPYREREARILRILSAAPKRIVPDSLDLRE